MKIRENHGFTLAEMLMVVVILGAILAIAAPTFITYRQNTNLREAVEDFSSHVALYKQRAMAENIRYQIVLDQAANEFSVVRSQNPDNLNVYIDLNPPFTKSFAQYSAQVIMTDGPATITMQPRGTLPNATIRLQHTGTARTATITTHISGRMNVEYEDAS